MSHPSSSRRLDRQDTAAYGGGGAAPVRDGTDAALGHARAVVALIFGPPEARTFDVRYWDGSVDRARGPSTAFRLGVNRPGALRRMLLPPSELSIVESY